jgi:integrase
LKETFPIATLTLADLQKYVTGREGKVQPGTMKMELISLRTAWNWGAAFGLVEGKFPNKGLRFPKSKEKPPFMTWDEVERRVTQGGLAKELWDCLYLTPDQTVAMLADLKPRAIQPWVHPMVAFAAHTGARRSEIGRVRTEDVDFAQGVITIREKKRRRGVDSTRRVPMSSLLAETLKEYLDARPPFTMLFRQEARVVRSKKKRTAVTPVTLHEAQNHFKRTLKGTKWSVLRGWHVLRHSFISALANRGVDQRVIQDMCGHMTAEMQRRYAHLYPSTKQDAIKMVFG